MSPKPKKKSLECLFKTDDTNSQQSSFALSYAIPEDATLHILVSQSCISATLTS